jgi:hypothetical protein
MTNHVSREKLLGTYLKDRRAKLDPATFGFPGEWRRTEVAQRANITPLPRRGVGTSCR